MGIAYQHKGEFQKGLREYLECKSVYEMLEDMNSLNYTTLLNNIGNIYGSMGKYKQALKYY